MVNEKVLRIWLAYFLMQLQLQRESYRSADPAYGRSIIFQFSRKRSILSTKMPQPQKGGGSNKHTKGTQKDQDSGKGGNHRSGGGSHSGGHGGR